MSSADRGKSLESRFKEMCKKRSERADFAYHRYPDARAGSLVTAPADFHILHKGAFMLVECKECKFDGRLPHANFAPDQVSRMRLHKLAGGHAVVLIHHTTSDKYRLLDVEVFKYRQEGKASWFFAEDEGLVSSMEEAFSKMVSLMSKES